MIFFLLAVQLISLSQAVDEGAEGWIDFEIRQVTNPMELSTGARWVPEEKALYLVDSLGQKVHRYKPDTKELTSIKLDDVVSVIIPVKGKSGEFIIGYGTKISVLSWDGKSDKYTLHHKFQVDKDKPGNRLNDGLADNLGRLWIGSMGKEKPGLKVEPDKGSLFRVSETCALENVLSPVNVSNGITWSQNNEFMYYVDSPTRKIDIFKFNGQDGKISERKTFFDFEENNIAGFPDSLTTDSDGNLWIVVWGDGRIMQVSPKGQLIRSVWLPVTMVTSVAWGGPNFDTLFVTSMRHGLNSSQLEAQPSAGALFQVTGIPAKGLPANSLSSCYLSLPDLTN